MQNAEGAILGPFDCWLAMRGLKTMALRMRQQAASAAIIARWLARHPLVKKVNYPGLPAHPGHDIHVAQASAGGSLLSFETGRCAACQTQVSVFRVAQAGAACALKRRSVCTCRPLQKLSASVHKFT